MTYLAGWSMGDAGSRPTALAVFTATDRVGWALAELLGSGMTVNALVHKRRGR